MSTAAQVRAAWKSRIFDNATIQAMTTKIYDKTMQRDGTTSQLALLKYQQDYNWMEYVVSDIQTAAQ